MVGCVTRRALYPLVMIALMVGFPTSATARSPTFSLVALTGTVSGSAVTVSVTVRASAPTVAQKINTCVRNGLSTNVDFVGQSDVTMNPTATVVQTKSFPVGSYRYFACVKYGDSWHNVGPSQYFTIIDPSASTANLAALGAWQRARANNASAAARYLAIGESVTEGRVPPRSRTGGWTRFGTICAAVFRWREFPGATTTFR